MAKIKDGKGTTLTGSGLTIDKLKIKTFGIQGGGKIDATHLGNTAYMTAWPKSLKEITDIEFEGHFDPSTLISAPYHTNQAWTITYPNIGTHVVYGWLEELVPGDIVVGDKCTVTGKIIVSNLNGSDVETAPAFATA